MFTNLLNISLPRQAWVEKTVFGEETLRLSNKEKVPGAALSKDHTDSLLRPEKAYHSWKKARL